MEATKCLKMEGTRCLGTGRLGDELLCFINRASCWGQVVRGLVVRGPVVRGPVVRGPVVRGPVVRGPIDGVPLYYIVTKNLAIGCSSFS